MCRKELQRCITEAMLVPTRECKRIEEKMQKIRERKEQS